LKVVEVLQEHLEEKIIEESEHLTKFKLNYQKTASKNVD